MSIASEITRLQTAKSDLATSIANKGVTVPANATLDDYAALVDSIQTGGGESSLPYDAEIEYLECTGMQYINPDITLDADTTGVMLIFNAAITAFVSGNSSLMVAISSPNSGVQVYTASGNKIYNQGAYVSPSINTFYTFTTTTTSSRRTIQLNSGTPSTQSFSRSITDNSKLEIMGYSDWVDAGRCSKAKYKSFQIYINGIIVRYYIPVRVGTVGYMYDKISGELFGNAGSGSFTLGPDVS